MRFPTQYEQELSMPLPGGKQKKGVCVWPAALGKGGNWRFSPFSSKKRERAPLIKTRGGHFSLIDQTKKEGKEVGLKGLHDFPLFMNGLFNEYRMQCIIRVKNT